MLNPEGKYYCTKFHSSGSKVWNPKTSERFHKSTTDAPGAGNYQPQHNDLSDSGKYVLSKYKGDGKRKLAHGFRDSFVDLPAKITESTFIVIQLRDQGVIAVHPILGNMMVFIIGWGKALLNKLTDSLSTFLSSLNILIEIWY
jgi:hypothetical protein